MAPIGRDDALDRLQPCLACRETRRSTAFRGSRGRLIVTLLNGGRSLLDAPVEPVRLDSAGIGEGEDVTRIGAGLVIDEGE